MIKIESSLTEWRIPMYRFHIVFLILALVIVVPISITNGQTKTDSLTVSDFYSRWFSSLRQSPETYASFYAEDGTILPPNRSPSVGRTAIAEWLRQSQASSPYNVRPESITVDEMRFLSSDWVVHRTTLKGQRIPKEGGDPTPFETKYFDLLHRNTSNQWEVVYRMWSDN